MKVFAIHVLLKCADSLASVDWMLVTCVSGDSLALNASQEAPSVIQNIKILYEPQSLLFCNILNAPH